MTATATTRSLGRSGITVSALGLGCWAIGGPFWSGDTPLGWGEVDDAESTRAIRRGLDLGVTFFDTANVYGAGHSERVLGRALGADRSRVVIATKWGNTFDEQSRQTYAPDPSPEHVGQAVRASLARLGTDYIDLYQLHLNDAPIPQALELVPALEKLVDEGLIRSYGWSTDFPERAEAFAAAGQHVAAVQFQANVLDQARDMTALCERLGLAGINRGPLAMGLLTGKFSGAATPALGTDDVRGKTPEWMSYFTDGVPAPQYLRRIAAVREVLTSGGRTLAQGALAWLWAASPVLIPIPGFRTVAQVEENVGALAHGPLTPEQLTEIETLLSGG
jgi:aryl-alcohol dehydrogenase-like predicted oxidoreductase